MLDIDGTEKFLQWLQGDKCQDNTRYALWFLFCKSLERGSFAHRRVAPRLTFDQVTSLGPQSDLIGLDEDNLL